MITIFIGSTNRLVTLERTILSYSRFVDTEYELVIVDNGTDHPECVDFLDRIEGWVKKVYRLPACDSMEEVTDNFNIAIRDQYDHGDAGEWFAVSEADVCFEGTSPDALDVYVLLAEALGTAVGPHLRVQDVPACYPLRSRVLACESRLLYREDMHRFPNTGIRFSECQTDTTFHLFPCTRRFERLHLNPMRVGWPHDAMHLDWYLDIFNPTRENEIYIPGKRAVGSWGKRWIRDFWADFQVSPEHAFERLMQSQCTANDLCNACFLAAWCYQYGHGVEESFASARSYLARAIPNPHEHYWPYEANWLRMIFDEDFASLGWDAE